MVTARNVTLAALLLVAAIAAGQARSAPTSAKAMMVLSAAKAATGGAAWDRIRGWHERGRHDDVAYDTLLDFRSYRGRYASTRDGKTRVHGFNGSLVWDVGSDGKLTTSRDPAAVADARLTSYFSTFAFFRPSEFPARFEYLGVQTEQGASFDVVRVTPEGVKPIEVWVDRSTHLPARLVDRSGPTPDVARSSDYREVGGVRQPFRIDDSDGNPAHAQTVEVDSVILEPLAPHAFDPPR